jgi:hypothetical protein
MAKKAATKTKMYVVESTNPNRAIKFWDYINVCSDHLKAAQNNGFDGEIHDGYEDGRIYCHFCSTDND